MSKYNLLWEYIQNDGSPLIKLTFDQIEAAAGVKIDHSFLTFKKELLLYGYEFGKISLKDQTVTFLKLV